MDWIIVSIVVAGIAAYGLWKAVVLIAREFYAHGRLNGLQEAVQQLSGGVSSHYEHDDKPLPERVAKRIDDTKAAVTGAKNAREKGRALSLRLWGMGHELGRAAWQDGFDAGQRFAEPHDGETRINLTRQELLNIHWLAHFGFERMLWNKEASFNFKDQKDAEEATHAIEKLERCLPKDPDDDDPYALAFNRQTMIWDKWREKAP